MDNSSLDRSTVRIIQDFINAKRNGELLKTRFPNTLLREDVLDILDMYCTVVYFPLDGEQNNGFHITGIPDKHGDDKHFVYINTAQTIEKQVFTAAHELGHVWKVDEAVENETGVPLSAAEREKIINRFAAELLMPEEQFISVFFSRLKEYNLKTKITVADVIRIIAALINHFFVPHKSVVYRLSELGAITPKVTGLLLGKGDIPEADITARLEECYRENGWLRFLTPTKKKWIDGLPELLEKAEAEKTVTAAKIQSMRQLFEIRDNRQPNEALDEYVTVNKMTENEEV